MSSLSSLPGASGKLLRRIHRACRPYLDEPNVALNLEICDLVNDKQGSLPHEASIAIVKLINSRDPQVSELALKLLDYLVKNCGYPVHLQISRKEFLNELVKRFPERPPPGYSRTQRLILGTIAEWTQTICKTSRHKEDFGYIRDMYRLLRSKGYEFPAVKKEDTAVLTPSDNLKSIEEVKKEDKLALNAKLHELVRRGRPQDLKEANEIMKILSGFKEDQLVEDSKQRVAEDLTKVKRKADILNEMLDTATNTGKFDAKDETIAELVSSLKVAQPKIQLIIQEDQEDQEQVTTLLQLNDKINNILERCSYLSKGDIANAAKTGSAGAAGLNLIDFDDDEPIAAAPGSTAPTTNDAMTDLLSDLGGLSFGGNTTTQQQSQPFNSINLSNLYGNSGAISLSSLGPASMTPKEQSPAFDLLGGNFGSSSQQQQQQQPASVSKSLDPFGFDFNSSTSSTNTPNTPTLTQNVSTPQPLGSPLATGHSKQVLSQSASIRIDYEVLSRSPATSIKFYFSNPRSGPTYNVQFSVAVTKAFELSITPASSTMLMAAAQNGITQNASISRKDQSGPATNIKIKWKVDMTIDGAPVTESGVATIA